MENTHRLIKDLSINHDKWRQEGTDLIRSMAAEQSNSKTTLTINDEGGLRFKLSGNHDINHRVKLGFFERRRVRKAAEDARERILTNLMGELARK